MMALKPHVFHHFRYSKGPVLGRLPVCECSFFHNLDLPEMMQSSTPHYEDVSGELRSAHVIVHPNTY